MEEATRQGARTRPAFYRPFADDVLAKGQKPGNVLEGMMLWWRTKATLAEKEMIMADRSQELERLKSK